MINAIYSKYLQREMKKNITLNIDDKAFNMT